MIICFITAGLSSVQYLEGGMGPQLHPRQRGGLSSARVPVRVEVVGEPRAELGVRLLDLVRRRARDLDHLDHRLARIRILELSEPLARRAAEVA